MNSFLRKLLGMNWLLVCLAIGLSVFGVIAIYSATYMREEAYLKEMWRRQIVFLVLGVAVFFVAALINYRYWLSSVIFPLLLYLAGLGFLVLTHFFGRTTFGAKSWLDLGPISFQPAQLAIVSTFELCCYRRSTVAAGFDPTGSWRMSGSAPNDLGAVLCRPYSKALLARHDRLWTGAGPGGRKLRP
jgi:hypothetical protein